MLDRSENYWPEVCRNFRKELQVCIQIGKLLRREGSDLQVSAMLYRELVHTVLLFGAETWFLLAAISRNLEGVHVGFLRQGTDKKTKQ